MGTWRIFQKKVFQKIVNWSYVLADWKIALWASDGSVDVLEALDADEAALPGRSNDDWRVGEDQLQRVDVTGRHDTSTFSGPWNKNKEN